MFDRSSEQILSCYEHAEQCARKAAAQRDPKLKQDFLDLQTHWLALARTYASGNRSAGSSAQRSEIPAEQ
jgi:hypothetical protein